MGGKIIPIDLMIGMINLAELLFRPKPNRWLFLPNKLMVKFVQRCCRYFPRSELA